MATTPRDPSKDQDPKPEPIDPPDDAPPVELPGEPMDRPNLLSAWKARSLQA